MTLIEKLAYKSKFEAWKRNNGIRIRRGNAIAAFLGKHEPEELEKALFDYFEQDIRKNACK